MTRQGCESNVANMADMAVDMAHMLMLLLTWIGLKWLDRNVTCHDGIINFEPTCAACRGV